MIQVPGTESRLKIVHFLQQNTPSTYKLSSFVKTGKSLAFILANSLLFISKISMFGIFSREALAMDVI